MRKENTKKQAKEDRLCRKSQKKSPWADKLIRFSMQQTENRRIFIVICLAQLVFLA
jgi:hypothetical protein